MTSRAVLLVASGLSVLSGVLMFLGWPGFEVWPLQLIAFVPYWWALELVADRSWRTAFGVGLLCGVVALGGGYHWMLEATHVFSSLGWLASTGFFALCSIYLGLQYAFQGVLYWAVRGRGWPVAVAGLPGLVLTEWLYPKWFPVYVGNALLPEPLLAQSAELGGPLLVSFLVGVINVAVFEAVRAWCGRRAMPAKTLVAAAGFVGLLLLHGAVRIEQLDREIERAASLEVGLVQANVSIEQMRVEPFETVRRHVEQSRDLEAADALDLLVWPEVAYYPYFGRTLPFSAEPLRDELETPLVFGSYSVAEGLGRAKLYNSVFLMHRDGTVRELYDKTQLLIGGEYLPFGETFPILYKLSPNTGRLTAGLDVDPLSLGPWRISTPICYEDTLPRLVRRMVNKANPHLLVNLTDDIWLGDSRAPQAHLRLAQFRAVEHRRYLVRATNSGVSAVIDPVGRIVASTEIGTRENLRSTVHMMEGRTAYARFGDWPGWVSLVVTLFTLIRRRRVDTDATS